MDDVVAELKALASVDLFDAGRRADTFIGHPFYFDFTSVKILVNDKWKNRVGGIPAGSFLLASYDGEPDVSEMVLLRVLGPTSLPSDSDVVASMVEYYKEDLPPGAKVGEKIDSFTRYEFMFSGLLCRILGTFYRDGNNGHTLFGADVDNFYSAHNYSVYRPTGNVLEYIVNFREGTGIPGGTDQVRLGEVRYSASRRHQQTEEAPVYVSARDFVGQRTALFGMTRTGKSNTVKKIIESTVDLGAYTPDSIEEAQLVGQIIFDVNGEYANPNLQDAGTAISELFADQTTRYSLLEKVGFYVMKINFHADLLAGFGLLQSFLDEGASGYVSSFLSISLEEPSAEDKSAYIRWQRVVAAYRACLHRAGFSMGNSKITFTGNKDLNALAGGLDPTNGLSGEEAATWFDAIWENYNTDAFFQNYRKQKGREWADEDLKSVLQMLTRKTTAGGSASVLGFRKLQPFRQYHTDAHESSFETDIANLLRQGKIVIIDLSQGDPDVQRTYADRICKRIFSDAMGRFIQNQEANYIQLYFEEAHNLFPKKDEADLSRIYNRLAKEGAKLRLGLVYATQEVSSLSANVLKNTQNWFVSHLNNRDELREVSKFYDYEDFVDSIRVAPDRGFIRMKTHSNAFVVPVQVDRFLAKANS